jgi:hypothetical protein
MNGDILNPPASKRKGAPLSRTAFISWAKAAFGIDREDWFEVT